MSSNSWKTLGNVSSTNNLVNVGFDSVVVNNIIVKNGSSINGDTTINGKLTSNSLEVVQDTSLNGRLFVDGSTVFNQLPITNSLDIPTGSSFITRSYADSAYVAGSVLLGDLSLNHRLYVAGDVSFSSGLYVGGSTTIVGDVSMDSRLFVMGDVSINGSLYVAGNTSFDILSSPALGNVAIVDSVLGNDSTASVGGKPYLTVESAVSAVTVGQTVWILPGTYTLASGITIPNGVALRGINVQNVTIQMLDVTADTTLLTMGENSRIEDITFKLTSAEHWNLTGILFTGTMTTTTKLRTCVLTVDNRNASFDGESEVYGVLCSGAGTGSLVGSFAFNSLKGCTVNVYSNGGGNKRGVLVSSSNIITTRDFNIYVAQPTDTASTGSYVGVEVNDPTYNTGSIQMRATTVGVVTPIAGQSYTASDILQTTPATITDPTYLASPGIQIGPGTDLVTKTAGDKAYSVYLYPLVIFYGLKGNVGNSVGYLWPGTMNVIGGINGYPDITTPAAYYRIQQPVLLSGITASLNQGPTSGQSLTLIVRHTPVGGSMVDTLFTLTFTDDGILDKTFFNSSKRMAVGDKLHLYVETFGGSIAAHDLQVQIDLF